MGGGLESVGDGFRFRFAKGAAMECWLASL
jgi:hypothetical protein